MKIKEILNSVPRLSQVQYSTIDQIYQVFKVADKLELMIARDYLNNLCKGHKIFAYDCLINSIIEKWQKVDKEDLHYDSINVQLQALVPFAIRLGLGDAADFIKDSL